DGAILEAYKKDPRMDLYLFVKEEVQRITHMDLSRGTMKTLLLGRLYGMGLGSLAERLRISVDETKVVREAQNRALPGLPELEKAVKAAANDGIRTWGGRVYHCEPPKWVEKFGREMSFE